MANPDVRRRISEGARAAMKNPDVRRRIGEASRDRQADPAVRRQKAAAVRHRYDTVDIDKWAASPNGAVHHVRNYERFAREYGLNVSTLHRVLNGKAKTCKGWRAATSDEIREAKTREAEVQLAACGS